MENIYTLKKQNLISFIKSLNKSSDVYLPARDNKNNVFNFFSLKEIEEDFSFSSQNDKRYSMELIEKTRLSPKHILFPQYEKLLDFHYEKNPENIEDVKIELEVTPPERKSIIFGLKPCDVQGISRMDKVFSEGQFTDPYYIKRRANTVLIAIGCDTVFDDCFCSMVGGSPYNFDNSDIGLMETDGSYVVFVYTDKGEAIVENNEYLETTSDKEKVSLKSELKEKDEKSSKKIESMWPGTKYEDIPDIMDKSFNLKIWEKLTEKCISCGACTFVCPTCYCFDIRDEKDNKQGQRYRCWDFCTSYIYTLEASGHNPRESITKRYKNKVNCKFNYNYKRHGNLYCVGCGRCIDVCPVDMDIREIVAAILEESKVKDK